VLKMAVRRSQMFDERGKVVEHIARLVDQVAPDHLPGTQVDEVPVVDPVHAPQVELEELFPSTIGRPLARRLLGHDLDAAGANLVDRTREQRLDLAERHLLELVAEREDLAHSHPNERVALAVLPISRLEIALDLRELDCRLVALEPLDVLSSGQGGRHGCPRPT